MEIIKPKSLKIREFHLYSMLDAFDVNLEDCKIEMGKAIMEPGVRVPKEGMNSHDGDEFSYIIKGSLSSGTEDITTTVSEGNFSYIPKETPHWSRNDNDENCELIWILIKKNL
jgi:quercetin dioxygenase-like cupin family protein